MVAMNECEESAVSQRRVGKDAFRKSPALRSLGENLNEYRLARQWSILRLCKECGVSHAFITQIIEFRANPSILLLEKIAENLGVELSWLLTRDAKETTTLSDVKQAMDTR